VLEPDDFSGKRRDHHTGSRVGVLHGLDSAPPVPAGRMPGDENFHDPGLPALLQLCHRHDVRERGVGADC